MENNEKISTNIEDSESNKCISEKMVIKNTNENAIGKDIIKNDKNKHVEKEYEMNEYPNTVISEVISNHDDIEISILEKKSKKMKVNENKNQDKRLAKNQSKDLVKESNFTQEVSLDRFSHLNPINLIKYNSHLILISIIIALIGYICNLKFQVIESNCREVHYEIREEMKNKTHEYFLDLKKCNDSMFFNKKEYDLKLLEYEFKLNSEVEKRMIDLKLDDLKQVSDGKDCEKQIIRIENELSHCNNTIIHDRKIFDIRMSECESRLKTEIEIRDYEMNKEGMGHVNKLLKIEKELKNCNETIANNKEMYDIKISELENKFNAEMENKKSERDEKDLKLEAEINNLKNKNAEIKNQYESQLAGKDKYIAELESKSRLSSVGEFTIFLIVLGIVILICLAIVAFIEQICCKKK